MEGNKVKLSIEVDEQEFEKDIDAAFRKIAREVRIPGFRPGKAPRRILEARLGKETGRVEALREALPVYYSQAVREHDVDVVAPPEIDITSGEESGAVAFDAVVEVRPQIRLAGYGGLRVQVPSPIVTDEDIDAQVDRRRSDFATLQEVGRPARDGDHLNVNMHATRGGEAVDGLSYDDFLYELGSGTVLPELDVRLQGARVGDILTFDAEIPGSEPVSLNVLVKDVKEKVLPELTDEWVEENTEFDTVEEVRSDYAKRIGAVKRVQAAMSLRNGAVEALVELVDSEPPETLLDAEAERQLHDLSHRLESQGATVGQYLEAVGQTPNELYQALRAQAVPSVKADLALRAVAEAEGIEPTEEDLEAEIERMARAYDRKPAQLRRELERADQMPAVRSDWKKSKALEWVVERVEIVDGEGHPVDRALLEPEGPEAGPEGGSDPEAPDADPEAPEVSED
jgi:trigger factor